MLYLILRLLLDFPLFGKRRIVLELHFKLRRRFINRLEQNSSIVLFLVARPVDCLHFHFPFFLHFVFAFFRQNLVFRSRSEHPLGIFLQIVLRDLFKVAKDGCTVLEAVRFTVGVGKYLINFRLHLRKCAILDHPHKLSAVRLIIDLHIAGKFLQADPRRRELLEDLRESQPSEGRAALQAENLGLHLRYYYIDTS